MLKFRLYLFDQFAIFKCARAAASQFNSSIQKRYYLRQYLGKVQHFQKTSKVLLFQYIAQVLKPQVHTPVLPKVVPLKSSTLGNTFAPPVAMEMLACLSAHASHGGPLFQKISLSLASQLARLGFYTHQYLTQCRLQPFQQILNQAGKACQGQTLQLIMKRRNLRP